MRNLETIEAIEAAVEADDSAPDRWAWLARQPPEEQIRVLLVLFQNSMAKNVSLEQRIAALEQASPRIVVHKSGGAARVVN